MKYIRKVVILVITALFVVSIAIGVGIIFALKNVNITLKSYLYSEQTNETDAIIAKYKEAVLAEHRGSLLMFINSEDIESCFDGTPYIVESCVKQYPCTINITVKERREVFTVQRADGSFDIFDDAGVYLRHAEDGNEAMNPIDNAPNVIVYKSVSVAGGSTDIAAEDLKEFAKMAAIFTENFSGLRSVVEKIELQITPVGKNMIFYLRCGMSIDFDDYNELTEQKIKAAAAEFGKLTGEQKLRGRIYALVTELGEVVARYSP